MPKPKLIAEFSVLATLSLCLICLSGISQQLTITPTETQVETSDTIFRQATNSPGYLVVKKADWDRLKNAWRDSLNQVNQSLIEEQVKYSKKIDSITSIKNSQSSKDPIFIPKEETIPEFSDQKMLVFGFLTMILIFYSLIITFRLFSQKSGFKSQNDRLDQIEKDFDQHKRSAIERERKLMRELIDTQNQLAEEKSRQKSD